MNEPTPSQHARSSSKLFGGRPSGADAQTHVLDYFATFYRHRIMATSAFLLVLLLALVTTYTTVPMYRATARLIIEVEDQETTALAGVLPGVNEFDPEPYYQTQFRILSSRELARRTVKTLDLSHVPEMNGTGETVSRLGRLTNNVRRQFGLPTEEAVPPARAADENTATAILMSRIAVEPVKNSRLVDVGFIATDPTFAATAVNALAREYVEQNKDTRSRNVLASLQWLTAELVRQKAKVEASEQALASYREDQNAISLQDTQNIVVARLNQLNDVATRAKTNRVQKESLYNQVKSIEASASADAIPAILENQYIQTVKAQLADLERERTNLMERYGERHPEMVRINAAIRDASRQLALEIAKAVDAIRNDYQAALAEEVSLSASLEEQKGAAMTLGRKSVSYSVLEREAQSNRQVYESLLQREKELQVMVNSRGNNVRVMELADVPSAPYTPNLRRNLSLGGIAGFILAMGLVFGVSYLDDTIKTPEDVTGKLQVPFLGMVPKTGHGPQPFLTKNPPHAFGEAFRSLRTSLVFSNGKMGQRVIMVTSAQPLEGKTTTACNLAMALAIGGERVLLIDADMRRPGVTRAFGLESRIGLSHLLTGQASAKDAIQKLENNLWVMPSGSTPPNPSELLASERMKIILTNPHQWFDWIIVDTPPVLAVTDAVLLAPLASGVAFVVRSEMTPRRHVTQAMDTLKSGNPRILGAILNGVDLTRNKYYYSRYYGYEHTNYYVASA